MAQKTIDESGNVVVTFEADEYYMACSRLGQRHNFFTHVKGFAYLRFAEIILSVMLKAKLPDDQRTGYALLNLLIEKVIRRVYETHRIEKPYTFDYTTAEQIFDEVFNLDGSVANE